MKTITEKKKIEALLTRGVEKIYPNKDFLKKRLESGEQLTVYTGYDPTAPTLHIGHGITLLKLRQFQKLGHKVIMLIGDFTGMIGDPTDKLSARKRLTYKQVIENCKNYKKQAAAILDFEGENPVEIKYNSEWLDKLTAREFIDLFSHFTVPRLLERDMFQERLKKGETVYLHEFVYPVLQAYDSVAMKVDGEVGGNDQTFNMLVGRDLMKGLKNKEKFVLTIKLLADSAGVKMGKSVGNMVALSEKPEDMFGKVMSWPDNLIIAGFELCTWTPMEGINKLKKEFKVANPRDLKMKLAFEIVKMYHSEKTAKEVQNHFVKVFSKKEKPSKMPEIKPSKYDIVTVLVESGICSSRGDARRQIEQGGVKVNGNVVETHGHVSLRPGDIVQKGSRWFVRIL